MSVSGKVLKFQCQGKMCSASGMESLSLLGICLQCQWYGEFIIVGNMSAVSEVWRVSLCRCHVELFSFM